LLPPEAHRNLGHENERSPQNPSGSAKTRSIGTDNAHRTAQGAIGALRYEPLCEYGGVLARFL